MTSGPASRPAAASPEQLVAWRRAFRSRLGRISRLEQVHFLNCRVPRVPDYVQGLCASRRLTDLDRVAWSPSQVFAIGPIPLVPNGFYSLITLEYLYPCYYKQLLARRRAYYSCLGHSSCLEQTSLLGRGVCWVIRSEEWAPGKGPCIALA